MMTDKERIEFVIKESGLTYVEFSARTGISPATLSHITSGRSKPTLAIMRGILTGFPSINSEWLFLGTGRVYKTAEEMEMMNNESDGDAESGDLFSSNISETGAPSEKKKSMIGDSSSIDITSVIQHTVEAMRRPERKITEVRIFFDDGTYEAFFKS